MGTRKVQLIPTILVKNATAFKERVLRFGTLFPVIQLDIADGKFVKNKTFADAGFVKKIKTPVAYELHLMVKDPLAYITAWRKVPAVHRIIFHYEAVEKEGIVQLIKKIVQHGCEVGMAINPGTPVTAIQPWLGLLDMVLVMGVDPGFNGAPFKPSAYAKLRKLRQLAPQLPLGIDGGVNPRRAKALRAAGATILYSGSFLWSQPDLLKAKQQLLTQ